MVDISGLVYLMPLFSFILVFVILFAILKNINLLGENNFIMDFVSFIIAIIFISFSDVRSYFESIIPWFVILLIVMFFIIFLGMFALGKGVSEVVNPGFVWVFVIVLFLIILIEGYSHFLAIQLPLAEIKNFFFNSEFSSSILLGIMALVVSLIIIRK